MLISRTLPDIESSKSTSSILSSFILKISSSILLNVISSHKEGFIIVSKKAPFSTVKPGSRVMFSLAITVKFVPEGIITSLPKIKFPPL